MTSKEFVVWMQGFVTACNDYSPTPKQWDTLKDKLGEVKDDTTPSYPVFTPNMGGTIQTLPFIQPAPSDPYNPYKITSGTTGQSGVILTTTPNSGGTVTYNPSTTTLWNPSGSVWSYTSTLPQQQPKVASNQLELNFEKEFTDEEIDAAIAEFNHLESLDD
jgi:hypothetical protein